MGSLTIFGLSFDNNSLSSGDLPFKARNRLLPYLPNIRLIADRRLLAIADHRLFHHQGVLLHLLKFVLVGQVLDEDVGVLVFSVFV